MSSEPSEGTSDTTEGQPPAPEAGPDAPQEEPAAPAERVDEDGLPLDRDATIDDVRSKEGLHGRFALGCALAIVLLIVAFWLIRGGIG